MSNAVLSGLFWNAIPRIAEHENPEVAADILANVVL
jgi:hypothetical protein